MSKFVKQFTMPTPSGSLADKVAKSIKDAEIEHGKPMRLMRNWMKAGYILDNFGHGLLESLVAMVEEGHTEGMSQKEKADLLKNLIDRTYWRDQPAVRPIELDNEVSEEEVQQPNQQDVSKKKPVLHNLIS